MSVLRRHWFALLAIAAALVRLPRPAPWWYDEAFTAWLTQLSFPAMIQATRGDVHPPAFYTAEWLIAHLPGATDTALRLLPAVCSLAALFVARAIAQRLRVSTAAQVVGLTLMAVSGFQLYYAQEARSYSLLMLLSLVGAWAVLARRWWWLFAAFAGLLYTHSYGLLYSAALGMLAVAGELRLPVVSTDPEIPPADLRAPLIAGAGALALYAPWFVYATLGQLAEFQDHWIWPPTVADVLTTYAGFLYGSVAPTFWKLLWVASGIALLLFALYRVVRDGDERVRWLAYLAAAPVALAILASYVVSPLYLGRALIGASAPYYLIVGWALTERVSVTARAWAAAILIPLIAISGARDQLREQAAMKFSAAEVSQLITAGWQPGDIVYHVSLYSRIEMQQYLGERAGYLLPAATAGLDKGGLTAMTRTAMGFGAFQRPLDSIPYRRAWLVAVIEPIMQDLRPERDQLLAARPWRLVYSATHMDDIYIVEVYQLWPHPTASGSN